MSRDVDGLNGIARQYQRFADVEAHGSSPLYETLASAVAGSALTLRFLECLPSARRQPNLFLAAVRHVAGLPDDQAGLERIVDGHAAAIRSVMLSHSTQTNEPGRCAVLLPVLARLPQPLALLEVGASAGLCLWLDRYAYDYGGFRLTPDIATEACPTFHCSLAGEGPVPPALPKVAWRRGIDLNPLDLGNDDDVAWLETLIWPEHEERLQRMRAAVSIAKREPSVVKAGDLLKDLPKFVAEAPAGATLVVFHSAVLGYISEQADREQFVATVRDLGAVWVSNEVSGIFPAFAKKADPSLKPSPGSFLLAVNGEPVAWTQPHGLGLTWLPGAHSSIAALM